jgi:LEA14-like dessication related protein
VLALAGCAGMPLREPPRVNVVGIESLEGEGLELRFALRLRVQNPNEAPIDFDGIALDLLVNNRLLASGVSDVAGSVPRFGEAVVTVPVTISMTAAVQQMLGLLDGPPRGEFPVALRGRLGGGPFGGVPFSAEGTLRLPR